MRLSGERKENDGQSHSKPEAESGSSAQQREFRRGGMTNQSHQKNNEAEGITSSAAQSSRPDSHGVSKPNVSTYKPGQFREESKSSTKKTPNQAIPGDKGIASKNNDKKQSQGFHGESKQIKPHSSSGADKAAHKVVEPKQHSKTIQYSEKFDGSESIQSTCNSKDESAANSDPTSERGFYKPGQFKEQKPAASKPIGTSDKLPYQPGQTKQPRRSIPQAFPHSIRDIENSVARGANRDKAANTAVEPKQQYKPGQFKEQKPAASKSAGTADKVLYQPGQFKQLRRSMPQAIRDSIRGAKRAGTSKSNLHSQEDYKKALEDDEVSFLSKDASVVNKKGSGKARSAKTARERAERKRCCTCVTPAIRLVLSMILAITVALGILSFALFAKKKDATPVGKQGKSHKMTLI
jgi:hypothetical protein